MGPEPPRFLHMQAADSFAECLLCMQTAQTEVHMIGDTLVEQCTLKECTMMPAAHCQQPPVCTSACLANRWDRQPRQAACQCAAEQHCRDVLHTVSATRFAAVRSSPTHFDPCASSLPARALPAMLHTMKQAKMKPCGRCSPRGDSAGVQRKTKVYMEPSKRLCIAPSSAILGSAGSMEG